MVLGFGRRRDEAILHWQAEVKFWKQQLDKCVHEKNYVLTMCYGAQRQLKVQEAESLLLQEQVRQQAMQLELLQHKLNQASALRSAASTDVAHSISSLLTSPRPAESATSKMLEAQLASCQTRLKELEMALLKAEEQVDTLTQALEQTKAELACAKSTVEAYETESEQLRRQLVAARGLGDDTAGQAAWLAQQLSESHAATQQLRAEVTMKEQMINIMQMQLREMRAGGSTYSSGDNTPLGSYAPSNATFGPAYGAAYHSNGGHDVSASVKEQLEQLRMSLSHHAYATGTGSDAAGGNGSGFVSAKVTPRNDTGAATVSIAMGQTLPSGLMQSIGVKNQPTMAELLSASMQAHGMVSLTGDVVDQQLDVPLDEDVEVLLAGMPQHNISSRHATETGNSTVDGEGGSYKYDQQLDTKQSMRKGNEQQERLDDVAMCAEKEELAPDVVMDAKHADQHIETAVLTPVRGLVETEDTAVLHNGAGMKTAAAEKSTVDFVKIPHRRTSSMSSDRSDRVNGTPTWNQMLRPTNKQKSEGNVHLLDSKHSKQEEEEDFNVSNIIARFGSKQGGAVVPVPLYGEGSKSMRMKPAVHPVARTGASGAAIRIPSITAAAPGPSSSPAVVG